MIVDLKRLRFNRFITRMLYDYLEANYLFDLPDMEYRESCIGIMPELFDIRFDLDKFVNNAFSIHADIYGSIVLSLWFYTGGDFGHHFKDISLDGFFGDEQQRCNVIDACSDEYCSNDLFEYCLNEIDKYFELKFRDGKQYSIFDFMGDD